MPTFLTNANLAAAITAAAANTSERFIEIGELPVRATIVRNGTAVVAPAVDRLKVDALVDRLLPVAPSFSPRVVSQSVPVGTHVQKGTAIDLVLVAPNDIDIGVIAGAHDDLKLRTIADVAPVLADPKLIAILEKYDDGTKASDADKATLNLVASQLNIGLDADPASGRSLGAFFNTLQGSRAFL